MVLLNGKEPVAAPVATVLDTVRCVDSYTCSRINGICVNLDHKVLRIKHPHVRLSVLRQISFPQHGIPMIEVIKTFVQRFFVLDRIVLRHVVIVHAAFVHAFGLAFALPFVVIIIIIAIAIGECLLSFLCFSLGREQPRILPFQ